MVLAERTRGEIVNADSRQIYRDFDAGTSKPSLDDRKKIPHHLVDFLDPAETYSAGEYQKAASAVLTDIQTRKKTAIVVGGTGLYIKSLFEGLSELPARNEAVRKELLAYAEKHGREALHERLKKVDAISAKNIPYQNIQRVIRALEVYEVSGRPLSHLHETAPKKHFSNPAKFFGILWDRSALKFRIAKRCAQIARPMMEESKKLIAKGVPKTAPAFQGLGYRSAVSAVEGKMDFDEFLENLVTETLQYAKRQMTWFRKDPKIEWIPAENPFDASAIAEKIGRVLI